METLELVHEGVLLAGAARDLVGAASFCASCGRPVPPLPPLGGASWRDSVEPEPCAPCGRIVADSAPDGGR